MIERRRCTNRLAASICLTKTTALLFTVAATCAFLTADARAELLPVGDHNGQSFEQWQQDYIQWGIATTLGGQSQPDTVNGGRYLPTNDASGNAVWDVTIDEGTLLIGSPFFLFGERYDSGPDDDATDPFVDTIFADAMITMTVNGDVVLEGAASDFPDRRVPFFDFPEPIVYTEPQPRGDRNSIAALFASSVGTVFDLPVGEHVILSELDSTFFGSSSITYNVSVVPEPTGLSVVVMAAFSFLFVRRRI
ncbi:MAG: hypothetical protein AAF497_12510 [Planctomycetota bacterium]